MKPECAICHNKVSDNTYLWIDSEQKLVHKVCQIINTEVQKDVVVQADVIKIKAR